MPRVQVKSPLGAQRIQPKASPVQTYSRPEVNELQKLAGSLAQLEPTLGRLATTVQQFENEEKQIEGENLATELLQQNKDDIAAAVKEGLIRQDQNPWFQLGMQQQFAEVAANRYSQHLLIKMQEWVEAEVPADEWFKLEAQERTAWAGENVEGLRGPVFDKLFSDSVEPKAYGFGLEFARRSGEATLARAQDLAYSQFTNELFNFQGEEGNQFAAIQNRLGNLQQWLIGEMDLDPRVVNQTLVRAVTNYAREFRDMRVLDLLDHQTGLQGGTGPLGNTEWTRTAVEKAREDIMDLEQQDSEHERYNRNRRGELMLREAADLYFKGELTEGLVEEMAQSIAYDSPETARNLRQLSRNFDEASITGNILLYEDLGERIMNERAGMPQILDAMANHGLSLSEGRSLMGLIQTMTNSETGRTENPFSTPYLTFKRGQVMSLSQADAAAELNLPTASAQLRQTANDAWTEIMQLYRGWLQTPEGAAALEAKDSYTLDRQIDTFYNQVTAQYFTTTLTESLQAVSQTLSTPGAAGANRLRAVFPEQEANTILNNDFSPMTYEKAKILGYDLRDQADLARFWRDLMNQPSDQEN